MKEGIRSSNLSAILKPFICTAECSRCSYTYLSSALKKKKKAFIQSISLPNVYRFILPLSHTCLLNNFYMQNPMLGPV